MRSFLRKLFFRPVLWATNRFTSRPNLHKIGLALDKLTSNIQQEPGKKGLVIPFDQDTDKFIIFSDQHKGGGDGADDFLQAEPNYVAALNEYYEKDFFFISLGDCEELWENTLDKIKKQHKASFDAEKKFLLRKKFIKIFGNHDLYWDNDPLASWQLKSIYEQEVKIYEGVILETPVGNGSLRLLCTHGHQGDAQSDGNWFSKFFISRIWAPFQAYLRINPNTPAYDGEQKTLHNTFMYDWSSIQKDLLLITGHTHQPVFASLTHLERLYKQYQFALFEKKTEPANTILAEIRKREREFVAVAVDYMSMKPTYFNTGCCCFSDGDITGIEIEKGFIRLIKWKGGKREMLEEMSLEEVCGLQNYKPQTHSV